MVSKKEKFKRPTNVLEQYTPIEHITRPITKFNSKGIQLFRRQIPSVACNGMTIDKGQGTSIPNVIVTTKRKLSTEHLYVACSRATSLNGLFIDGIFDPPKLKNVNVTNEMIRLRKESPLQFTLQFLQDFDDTYHKIYFHNIQSINKNFHELQADHCAMASDYLAFVEPWLKDTDIFERKNFTVYHRSNCSNTRNSEGDLLLHKKTYL